MFVTIKPYVNYVDDMLLKAFNRFHKNLKFPVATFKNESPHFLDLEICPNGLTIFEKTPTLDSTLT